MQRAPSAVPTGLPRSVLLLCWRDTDHPQGGGSERYLERVGAELVRRGVRVTLRTAAYPGAPATETRDGIRVSRGGGRLGVYPRALLAMVAARWGFGPLAGVRPDVVVDTQNGIPFFAALVSPAPVVVLVHHCHREQWPVAGPLLRHLGWFVESRLSPWVHRRHQYVTVSAPSAVELHDLGVSADRVAVVRNGIDPVPHISHDEVRAGHRLCVVSRLVPHKQIEDALEVVRRLRGTVPGLHLDVVGDGWWAPRLRELVRQYGIGAHVTFHGHVDEVTKHRLLATTDVHLMPSRKEGWGLAVIEAAQHGVPTIGYRHSRGLTDSVVDGETGLLVDDVDELCTATAVLVDDPGSARRLGEAARDRVADLSWGRTADELVEVFAAVEAGRRVGRRGEMASLDARTLTG
ncbi:glycosyltransferase family 4 protein [Williamsia sterculiae]|uniref:Glycosyltransferase involved in cell wall bisynthesis n=1 Tax=Williamsia sterculiae TaxID=1344003 RepID=A0A1N7CDR0_9NOCA|nr:glycosyltransferase family 4 protein [Williamsia sterculiae]SIR61726.1 Glycosyltransferase involved in cell wall bisynthesis [Williamsia sterculiae]